MKNKNRKYNFMSKMSESDWEGLDSKMSESDWKGFDSDINYQDLLNKYGPEGLFRISEKMKDVAMKDMDDAIAEFSPRTITKNREV